MSNREVGIKRLGQPGDADAVALCSFVAMGAGGKATAVELTLMRTAALEGMNRRLLMARLYGPVAAVDVVVFAGRQHQYEGADFAAGTVKRAGPGAVRIAIRRWEHRNPLDLQVDLLVEDDDLFASLWGSNWPRLAQRAAEQAAAMSPGASASFIMPLEAVPQPVAAADGVVPGLLREGPEAPPAQEAK